MTKTSLYLSILLLLAFPHFLFAQGVANEEKVINKVTLQNEPVRVTCISYSDGDDWIKDIKVEVENVSRRQIHDMEMDIVINGIKEFKDINGGAPFILISMTDQKKLLPGEKNVIGVNAIEYLNYKDILTKAHVSNVELVLRYVDYGNLQGWFKGAEYIQLLNNTSPMMASKIRLEPCDITSRSIVIVQALDNTPEPARIKYLKFTSNDEWLKNLEVEVENRSGKPIRYLECIALICDIKNISDCIAIPLVFESDKPVLPGEKVTLVVTEQAYTSAKQLVEKYLSMNEILAADITIGQIYYQNGNGWCNERSFATQSVTDWGKRKSKFQSYLIPKEIYVWGFLRDRADLIVGNDYLGGDVNNRSNGGRIYLRGYTKRNPDTVQRNTISPSRNSDSDKEINKNR